MSFRDAARVHSAPPARAESIAAPQHYSPAVVSEHPLSPLRSPTIALCGRTNCAASCLAAAFTPQRSPATPAVHRCNRFQTLVCRSDSPSEPPHATTAAAAPDMLGAAGRQASRSAGGWQLVSYLDNADHHVGDVALNRTQRRQLLFRGEPHVHQQLLADQLQIDRAVLEVPHELATRPLHCHDARLDGHGDCQTTQPPRTAPRTE